MDNRDENIDKGFVTRAIKHLARTGKDTLKNHILDMFNRNGSSATATYIRAQFKDIANMANDGQMSGRLPKPPAPPFTPKKTLKMGETTAPDARSNLGESLWRESVQVASTLPLVSGAQSSARAINDTAREIYRWARSNNISHVRDNPQVQLLFCDTYLDCLDG